MQYTRKQLSKVITQAIKSFSDDLEVFKMEFDNGFFSLNIRYNLIQDEYTEFSFFVGEYEQCLNIDEVDEIMYEVNYNVGLKKESIKNQEVIYETISGI